MLLDSIDCFTSNLASFRPLLLQIFFFWHIFFSASGTPIIHMLVQLMVCHTLRLFVLFVFLTFFSCYKQSNSNWSIFKFADSSTKCICSQNPQVNLFFFFLLFPVLVLSYPRICMVLFLYNFYLIIDMFYFVRHYSHTFSLLFRLGLISSNIFKLADFKTLICKSNNLEFHRDNFYWFLCFPLCMGYSFLFPCMRHRFLLKFYYFKEYNVAIWKTSFFHSPECVAVVCLCGIIPKINLWSQHSLSSLANVSAWLAQRSTND